MSGFGREELERVLAESDVSPAHRPRVFVETGTHHGRMTRIAVQSRCFDMVHTIEHHPGLWQRSIQQGLGQVAHCHLGDSADVLPRLCEIIAEPALFFLDAHWGPSDDMNRPSYFPLFVELDAIAERRHADIVVVDDLRSFGTMNPTRSWQRVTEVSIMEKLRRRSKSLRMGDQYVVYMT